MADMDERGRPPHPPNERASRRKKGHRNGDGNGNGDGPKSQKARNETELVIDTDASIMGRLGEFGQSVMKKKADGMMQEFASNLTKKATRRG